MFKGARVYKFTVTHIDILSDRQKFIHLVTPFACSLDTDVLILIICKSSLTSLNSTGSNFYPLSDSTAVGVPKLTIN